MVNEVLGPGEMRDADRLAIEAGVPSLTLMESAGRAVAKEIVARFQKCRVCVICGPGNNGGDGFAVARLLAARKWPVTVFTVGDPPAQTADAKAMMEKWRGRTMPFSEFEHACSGAGKPQLIVTALFGIGLNKPLPAAWVQSITAAKVPVVAVDLPAGLDASSGRPLGGCIAADLTVTFFRKKPCHLLMPGRNLCGEVVLADIGIPAAVLDQIKPRLWENTAPQLPIISNSAHKYSRGHAVVWSGPELATGASRLAAQAAARIGAGAVSLAGHDKALLVHAAHVSSIMLKEVADRSGLAALLADKRITAFCVGPAAGVGAKTRDVVLAALQSGVGCVLDADALSTFASAPDEIFSAIKALPKREVVMTPHEGEFARLFGNIAEAGGSKVEMARAAAAVSGAVVLYKGPDTVIAHPDGDTKINSNAPPKLATAGSGDVLAGLITGLMAQGVKGFEAACASAWLHGEAANRIPARTIIAEDLIEELSSV